MTDWQWCYENPKEAADEIDRLKLCLENKICVLLRDTLGQQYLLTEVPETKPSFSIQAVYTQSGNGNYDLTYSFENPLLPRSAP